MSGRPLLILSKTSRTLISLVALALLPCAIPRFGNYRSVVEGTVGAFLRGHRAPVPDSSLGTVEGTGIEVEPGPQLNSPRPGEIEDPSGRALDHFFASLLKCEREGKQTRICHYGDSPITNDGITSTVRRQLQLKFGDAGHGFVLIDKPWGWYGHAGVLQQPGRGWDSEPMFISRGDHLYGLGGASFTASAAGASATFGTSDEIAVGRTVSSFDIYFLAQPGGGDFDVLLDGQPTERVSTGADQLRSGFHSVKASEGSHKLTIRVVGNGQVRLFGVVLESGHAGVQYDSLGVNGAFIGLLAHYLDPDHWAEQLRHRNPDLVIIGYGTNESQFEKLPMDQYEQDTKEAIRRIRAALPDVSIMLLAPMDRGARGSGGSIVTRPMIPKLVGYQRRIAAETGCAFFDTFTAMGGQGTVARWHEAKPRLMGGDFTHPTAPGAEIVGSLVCDAMIKAYETHKGEGHADKGLRP